MSDDKNEKKDEEIVTNSESTEEVKGEVVEEPKAEVSEEPVIEAKAEEEPAPNTPEEKNEPITEATVEQTPEPEPTTVASNVEEPKVEIPDQVVNSNNNNYSNYQQNTSNTTNQAQTRTEKTPSEKKGMAIFALILSILGFFTSLFLIGGLFGFIAIILSIVVLAKKKGGKGMAITALILSLLSMFGACISALVVLPLLGIMGLGISTYNQYSDQLPDISDIYSNVIEEVEENYDLNEIGNIFDLNSIGFNTTSNSNTTTNSVSSNTTNTTTTNSVSNTTAKNNATDGISVGNYTIKYGKYEGEAAVEGEVLVLKENGTGTYEGEKCTWVKGSHDFAQDTSSRGSIKECIIVKTTEGTYYYYPTSNSSFTDGDIAIFNYVG